MSIPMLLVLSVGLAMDAFAVSICKGLAIKKTTIKNSFIVGLWFGGFQALMPLIGYALGIRFEEKIRAIDHWIAFALLGLIGLSMIKSAFSKEEDKSDDSLSIKNMFILSIATSIDALAIGVTLAFLKVNILLAISFIGVITFLLSAIGVKVGNIFGVKYKSKAELAGGVVLVILGIKILLEHLGIIG